MPNMMDYALSYVKRFHAIIPIQAWGKKKDDYKTPLIKDWTKEPIRTEEQVKKFWGKFPDASIGLVTGQICGGVIVLDFDNKPDLGINGLEHLREWEQETGKKLPDETWTALTGGGGAHWYFRTDKAVCGFVNNDLGIDLRADGNQVLLPPSLHYSGRRYQWEYHPKEYPLLEADETVWKFIEYAKPRNKGSGQSARRGSGGNRRMLLESQICEGGRTEAMKKLIGAMTRLGCEDETIKQAVIAENIAKCTPPLTEKELEKTVFPMIYRWEKGVDEKEWVSKIQWIQKQRQQQGAKDWKNMWDLLNSK